MLCPKAHGEKYLGLLTSKLVKFRTEICNWSDKGAKCTTLNCGFAHNQKQLRKKEHEMTDTVLADAISYLESQGIYKFGKKK